ncbi:hypothetical protein HZH66_001673 [Vespula vulgaris]|uniref:Uncharacterized protein n=1 Tax=Vespula vulgaris TaxID=7454 RepID=A0A834KI04_VESVU|nr:hypothetical protein HZH66_001673 [Vespula vulgaris]
MSDPKVRGMRNGEGGYRPRNLNDALLHTVGLVPTHHKILVWVCCEEGKGRMEKARGIGREKGKERVVWNRRMGWGGMGVIEDDIASPWKRRNRRIDDARLTVASLPLVWSRSERLVGRSVGWMVGWLVGWSVGRLVDWLVGWLVEKQEDHEDVEEEKEKEEEEEEEG